MPLFICWGPSSSLPPSGPDWLELLAPSYKDVRQLQLTPSNTSQVINQTPPPCRNFPPVERCSGQQPREDIKAFFTRQARTRERGIEKETPTDRQAHIQREKDTDPGKAPGRKGARVFWWEDIDGFRIRHAAGRHLYDAWWTDGDNHERQFDSYFNEWDICSDFSDHRPKFFSNNPYDDDDDDEPLAQPSVDNAKASIHDSLLPDEIPEDTWTMPDRERYSSTNDLWRLHTITNDNSNPIPTTTSTSTSTISVHDTDNDHGDSYVAFSNVSAIAHNLYGFLNQGIPPAPVQINWLDVAKVLGVFFLHLPPPDERLQHQLTRFFGHLSKAKTHADMPPAACDLTQLSANVNRSILNVYRRTIDGSMYFFLYPPSLFTFPYEIALTTASSVLQILRGKWGPSFSDIARELLARGIQFHIFVRGDPRPPTPPLLQPRFGGIGYRHQKYKPTALDYVTYENRRNRLLQSTCGRAALCHGGLIARLARAVVSFEDVIKGPSENVRFDGRVWIEGNIGFWDDALTDDDIDIICGVYHVDAGMYGVFSSPFAY